MSKLDERRKKYNIPEVPYLPMSKTVLIWRLPPEEKTAGGLLYVPEAHATVKTRGILLAAGLKALDVLMDALVEIGDEVFFGRYSGVVRELGDEEAKPNTIIECKVEDLLGSADALARVKNYTIEQNDEGDSVYVPKRKAS